MKNYKKFFTIFIAFVMAFSTSIVCFANTPVNFSDSTYSNDTNNTSIVVSEDGIYVNGTFYTQEQFKNLLNQAVEIENDLSYNVSYRSAAAAALIAGTWWIPVVGKVVITTTGAIIVGGAVVKAGTWVYNEVVKWFEQRQEAEIASVEAKIPERLKDGSGKVKIGNFDQKVRGRNAYKEKGGWTIEGDTAGHGGRKWKLKDKAGNRVASLGADGKVLSK